MRTEAMLLLLGSSISACGEQVREPGDAADPRTLDEVIAWDDAFSLEETPEVINVAPRVSVDPRGGYIVADMKEFQVRRYTDGGRLEGYFGAKGGGPGEFDTPPVVAVRLDDGTIVVGDFAGGLSLFDSLGQAVTSTARSSVMPLYAIVPLPMTGRLLLVGRGSEERGYPLLHVWDREAGVVRRSFFPAPAIAPDVGEALWVAAHAHASRHDSTVAVVFSADPRVYFFGLDGFARGSVPIPFAHFRPLRAPPSRRTRAATREWVESFSRVSDVFWVDADRLVVQYYDFEGMTLRWSLLGMTKNGRKLFEARNTPQLLAVSAERHTLAFVQPGSETPVRWVVGRLAVPPS